VLLRCAFEKIQRGGPIGPFPAVDPADRPAAANDRPGPRRGDRRRRLLAARAGARCRARDRLLRCRRPRGSRSTRGDSQRPPEKPGSWRSPRSTACTAIGWRRAPAARRSWPSGCWRGCGPALHLSPFASSTPRPCSGSARSPAMRSSRSALTALANLATSRPLPRLRHRHRGDPRRRRPRLPDGIAAIRMSVDLAQQLGRLRPILFLTAFSHDVRR